MKTLYIILKDNTVFETTFIVFNNCNIVFTTKIDDKVLSKTVNHSLIDSIRSSL